MNNIVQTKQEHLKYTKRNHKEAAYLGVYSTISVEGHGLSKTLPVNWFAIKSCATTRILRSCDCVS